jgi:hypothetical protein
MVSGPDDNAVGYDGGILGGSHIHIHNAQEHTGPGEQLSGIRKDTGIGLFCGEDRLR